MADDQYRRGSPGTARSILQQLLTTYPNEPELAPQAALRIADTYDREAKVPQADSSYREVLARYPRAKQAATASYKLALLLERQGKCPEALTQIDQLRRLFPLSDEVKLAENYRCPRQ
jgi:outer membrane protein assembly factor BamD (BamD/ComL family)